MTLEQQNLCLACLLAVAFDSGTDKGRLQFAIKGFLKTLPTEDVAKAANTGIDFSTYMDDEPPATNFPAADA